MSDSEEEGFCFYGKPLEQYDEDSIPKRKPIAVEEQIATDSHGRRRFHGAFTGGFSAGFFNTVGSLEGWKPAEFKSSRSEKAEKKTSKPEDYMDDEDMGEYGIAPQIVRATKDYAAGTKRKKPVFSEGPIPGIPVLHSLIEAGNETIGYLLMKNMDLRTKTKQVSEIVDEDVPKVYGCEMPKTYEIQRNIENEDIIPQILKECIKNPKNNTFGLGYIGLDKSELNLTKSTQLVVRDQNNRKLTISGQAFGVGAFENDDDDIYAKDDMSQYDFEITKEKATKVENRNFSHPEFVKGVERLLNKSQYPPPTILRSFSGKYKVRKSRFEPLEDNSKKDEIKRKDMNATIRAKYIGEEVSASTSSKELPKTEKEEFKRPAPVVSSIKVKEEKTLGSGLIFDKFVAASTDENPHDILKKVEPTYTEHGTKEMRDAVKLKMFGPLTRIVTDWQPCGLLCKRFNVREPVCDANKKDKKAKSQIFFEYEKHKDEGINFKPGIVTTKEEKNLEKIESEEIKISNAPVNEEIQESKPDSKETFVEKENKTVEETDRIDVAKNVDLFKAVFLSSSESESDDEPEVATPDKNQDDTREIAIKKNILTEDLITKIKTRKEGILSNIDFKPLMIEPAKFVGETTLLDVSEPAQITRNLLLYGPILPTNINKSTTDYKAPQMVIDEEWVEKRDLDKQRKKHKKEKRIKDKEKHRKSKHKK